MQWDPQQYERFDDDRTRPFHDLVARVRTQAAVVCDVGCGNGASTLTLCDRFPTARVIGLDSSAQMLDRARELDVDSRVEWILQDAGEFDPAEWSCDVVVSNACLQWVPTHRQLVRRWLQALPAGGTLAFQVPGNYEAPSHALMREAAERSPHRAELVGRLDHDRPVDSALDYARALSDEGVVDAWETTYVQWLDPAGEVADPVLEWVRGTGLRPLLGVLDPAAEQEFIADYAARLRAAYPRTEAGVAFPFRRIFVVARRR